MEKTVCELFAGVGGFRCGLNNIKKISDTKKSEKWKTVWFSQWEPADKKTQWAWSCYTNRFGYTLDKKGEDKTNWDIAQVPKKDIPNFNLLVGGFPCQDYSVASTLATSKGIQGKKGVLFWSILETIQAKKPPFILLENVDRLLKSPAKQRGRDFGIILSCLNEEGYAVEWRVINAADYGFQQRRRRIFIFAYKKNTKFYKETISKSLIKNDSSSNENAGNLLEKIGFFAKSFAAKKHDDKILICELPQKIGEVSDKFSFDFQNAGVMVNGIVYSQKVDSVYKGKNILLGDILEDGNVDSDLFISEDRLYYTSPDINHSDEISDGILSDKAHKTWQYIKGGKRLPRTAANGHVYAYSEGPVPMIDEYDKPARTLLTSEGSFSRSTHIVRDKVTGKIRLLTGIEVERIQGFPDNWTKECLVNGETIEMPLNKRRFMMGNALVVNIIAKLEKNLSEIFDAE